MLDKESIAAVASGTPQAPARPRLIIEHDPQTGSFSHRFEGDFPMCALVGHLEVIQAQLVGGMLLEMHKNMMRQAAGRVVGSDGMPMRS